MAKYQLPNNKVLTVPDDLPPDNRAQIAAIVKRDYGIDIDETTVLGQAYETFKGVPRGIVNTVAGAPLGVASLFDIGNDSDFVQGLKQYQDFLNTESSLASDPAYRDKWMTKLGEGAGSFLPFFGAGKFGQFLKTKGIGGSTLFTDPTVTVPAALGAALGVSAQADRVDASRALGEDVGGVAETFAELSGSVVGLSEALPIFSLLARVPKNAVDYPNIRQRITSALKTGGQEGLQEAGASLAQDLIAAGLYSDKLPIAESLFDEFTIGGAVGALADLTVNAISGRGAGNRYQREYEENARKNRISLMEEHKFKKAEKQGLVEEIPDLPDVVIPEIPPPAQVKPGPKLKVIQDAAENFSVVDLENNQSPVVKQFDKLVDALNFKNQEQTNYERKKLSANLENSMYSLGLPKSAAAKIVGATINDPNTSQVNLQTLVNFDSKLSKQKKKLFSKEKMEAGFRSLEKGTPVVYNEMLDRKKKHLKLIGEYVNSKGLDLKATYKMAEAKKLLSQKDYNDLLKDLSSTVFKASEDAGLPSIISDKEKVDVSAKYIKDIAASKNIDLDFKDPAVRYAALQWTGTKDITKSRNRGVKEVFLSRLHSLKPFNRKTKFPDFRPRKYSAQDVANFVAVSGSQDTKFSVKDLLEKGVTANDKAATEQFIDDLITSGRAEKVENTNKYRIRPNHQFDILRRAEGFNETPEQFGERLRKENELPEETIKSLVEDERKNQSNVLPPDEIQNKIFNFNEAVKEGRTNKLARELKKILDKAGLSETGLIVSNDILSTKNLVQTKDGEIKFDPRDTKDKDGQYDRDTDIIFLSLGAVNPDGTATQEQILEKLSNTLDREMIHAFREKDLISEPEYNYLRKEVKRKKVPPTFDTQFKGRTFYQRAVQKNQGNLTFENVKFKEEFFVEEAIAEMYQSRNHTPNIAPKAESILGKIAEFFRSLGRAMRISGFKRSSDIFNDIEQGVVGARERGQIRTLREIDRLESDTVDVTQMAEDEGVEAPSSDPTNVTELNDDGAIATPVTTFEDIESDTDPITGVLITPSGIGRNGREIFDKRKLTDAQKAAQKASILKEFGYQHRDSVDVLTWLSKNSPGKDYQIIADRLLTQIKKLKQIKKIDFQFRIIKTGTDRLDIRGHKGRSLDYLGVSYAPFLYDGNFRQQIYINDATHDGVDFETILHEFVHQATQAATYQPGNNKKTKAIINELENIRSIIRREIRGRRREGEEIDFYTQYGTKNIQELLAVGFTDRKFQEFMQTIPYSPKSKKNLWDKFTESIRKILNIPAKEGTIFSEFLLQAGKITNLSQSQIKPTIRSQNTLGGFDASTFTPQQQSILDEISDLNQQIIPIDSLLRQEAGKMSSARYKTLQDRRYFLGQKIKKLEEQFNEAGVSPTTEELPVFKKGIRFADDSNTTANKQLKEATEKAVEIVKQTPRGDVPYYNVNASDVALKSAIDFNEDATAKTPPTDLPNYSRGAVPPELAEAIERTGVARSEEKKSFGATLLDVINNPIENIEKLWNTTRQRYIDDKDNIERKIRQLKENNELIRQFEENANIATMSSIRTGGQARNYFRQLLTVGYITDTKNIEGLGDVPTLPYALPLEISTIYNDLIEGNTGTGGFSVFMAPLYADPAVDKEAVFGLYAKIKRVKEKRNSDGVLIDSPVIEKDFEKLKVIEKNYPEVVEAYENYQRWNNKLIDFAKSKGLLSEELAESWKQHSSYYPFYRDMVDDSGLAAPTIGGGYLTGNPLNIKMKGSKEAINVNPVEAIARNSLSILTASLKNDGKAKLMRTLLAGGEARILDTPEKINNSINQVPIFENGEKKLYEVDDIALYESLDTMGMNSISGISKFVSIPSMLLRETVTRSPDFMAANMLRDTLSATVTSGAPLGKDMIPILSTFKNMGRDLSELERLGVMGGFDFKEDQYGAVELMKRARKEQKISEENGISIKDAFIKLWDGLGAVTTKSEAATRYAVYESVYNDMLKRGYNEAQAQSAAQYQALEVINYGRRGSSVPFRLITAAVTFLNARIQGLDVFYRAGSGQYSSIEGLGENETLNDVKRRIQKTLIKRAAMLSAITLLYYLMVSDTEEYRGATRHTRDDHWIIPLPFGLPPIKIPIPFEVGVFFKVLPERLIDMAMGEDAVEKSPGESLKRQLGATLKVPFISGDVGIQAIKPLFEAINNQNSFTDSSIVQYYEEKRKPALQTRQSTSQIANFLGEAFNLSPLKIEHVLTGYTGSLGVYALGVTDAFTRAVTGSPMLPLDLNDIPILRRFFFDTDKAGGLQEQFYELREELQIVLNSMREYREQGRFDELAAYRQHNKGVLNVRGQVNAITRYMTNWRKRRDNLLKRTDISLSFKSDMLRDLEQERNKRLAILPALKERADSGMLD